MLKTIQKYNLDSIESCLQCLVDNMICLFFDYEYQDMPFFDWTSNCFDGRFFVKRITLKKSDVFLVTL